jgi:uncharacterized 2Fe-2S/4Fe-4S cluster protein (DUF4445 family)
MPKVTFLPDNISIDVAKGENLLRAAMGAEVHISATCGGQGTCGKCRVIIEEGNPKILSIPDFSQEELDKGYTLACQVEVTEDISIRIPVESRKGERLVLERLKEAAAYGTMLSEEDIKELTAGIALDPPIRKYYLEVEEPTLTNNADDLSRVRHALKKHGITGAWIDYPVLQKLADTLRQNNFNVTATVFNDQGHKRIVGIDPGDTSKNELALAIDIGTTTLQVKLIDLTTGDILARSSDYNPQISYGEDVITRVVYGNKEGGLKTLQEVVVKSINKLSSETLKKAKHEVKDVITVSVAGNTVMSHIFGGVSPKNIRMSPYIPTVTHWPPLRAKDLGLDFDCYLFIAPGRASYVGGDITAGILASGISKSDKLTLYIDVGTNGEIVLGNKDWLVACSCSAGPAFEGGTIRHGMRATRGAIEQVRLNWETKEPMILTIGQKPPTGFCGSGLIDALAALFLSKACNQKGKLDRTLPRVREGKFGWEYVFVDKEDSATDYDIVLTEVDIDNLIRAKAAVYAGIVTLLDSVGVPVEALDQIFIAGGFGHYLEVDKAITIGLLPEVDGSKVKFIGNGSLIGASLMATSVEMLKEADDIAKKLTYIEASADNTFMDRFMAALFLPHTEIDRFPKVKELLGT